MSSINPARINHHAINGGGAKKDLEAARKTATFRDTRCPSNGNDDQDEPQGDAHAVQQARRLRCAAPSALLRLRFAGLLAGSACSLVLRLRLMPLLPRAGLLVSELSFGCMTL